MSPLDVTIGLCGKMGAGKDEVAKILAERGWPTHSFAHALRQALATIAGIDAALTVTAEHKAAALTLPPLDILLANVEKAVESVCKLAHLELTYIGKELAAIEIANILDRSRVGLTVGRCLQLIGTECFRVWVDQDIWVRALIAGLPARAVIADVRFPNEAAAIKARGGVVVRIVRPTAGGAASHRDDGRAVAHASETSLDSIKPDYEIINDRTLDSLRVAARTTLGRLLLDHLLTPRSVRALPPPPAKFYYISSLFDETADPAKMQVHAEIQNALVLAGYPLFIITTYTGLTSIPHDDAPVVYIEPAHNG